MESGYKTTIYVKNMLSRASGTGPPTKSHSFNCQLEAENRQKMAAVSGNLSCVRAYNKYKHLIYDYYSWIYAPLSCAPVENNHNKLSIAICSAVVVVIVAVLLLLLLQQLLLLLSSFEKKLVFSACLSRQILHFIGDIASRGWVELRWEWMDVTGLRQSISHDPYTPSSLYCSTSFCLPHLALHCASQSNLSACGWHECSVCEWVCVCVSGVWCLPQLNAAIGGYCPPSQARPGQAVLRCLCLCCCCSHSHVVGQTKCLLMLLTLGYGFMTLWSLRLSVFVKSSSREVA